MVQTAKDIFYEHWLANPHLSALRARQTLDKLKGPPPAFRHYTTEVNQRVCVMVNSAKTRARNKGWDFDLDKNRIKRVVMKGVCQVTGVPFQLANPTKATKNPYAPSLDRINSNRGYVHANVKVVIWQYNNMKQDLTNQELVTVCQQIINGLIT
jgi:hypothetical protein